MHTSAKAFPSGAAGIGFDLVFDGVTYSAYDGIAFWAKSESGPASIWVRISGTTPDPMLPGYMVGQVNRGVYFPRNLALYTYTANNPVKYVDPDGRFLDVFLDAAFITYDVGALIYDEVKTGGENRGMNLAALGVDVAMLFVPFGTGGGVAVRGTLQANKRATQGAVQATRHAATSSVDNAVSAGTSAAASHADDVGKAVEHGNSKASEKAQHVYEIEKTTAGGKAETHKYGVSGGKVDKAGKSVRAETQVRRLNRNAAKGESYSSKIVEKVPAGKGARSKVLDSEKKWVEQYRQLNQGRRPRGNQRP